MASIPSSKVSLKDSLLHLRKYDLGPAFQEDMDTLDTLLSFEENIDQLLSNKRLDVQELLIKTSLKLKAVLRVHIFTTFAE